MAIEVIVAYTLLEATRRVRRGEIEVQGVVVVVDTVTNDVRGTRARGRTTPGEVAGRVSELIGVLEGAGARAVVVCQTKPMRLVDVTGYNEAIHRGIVDRRGVYRVDTQVRMDYLARDGYHVLPACGGVIDRMYACAVMGVPVPCPTPREGFRHREQCSDFEREWPIAGEGGGDGRNVWRRREGERERGECGRVHGWKW